MTFNEISTSLQNIPYMSASKGSIIYKMILSNEIHDILELGTAYGTGSCYMAAALHEKRKGSVVTIDRHVGMNYSPNVFELLEKTRLSAFVTPIFSHSSYTWELMKIIDRQTIDGRCKPIFDLVYIDGAHNFEIDCCAFFLADKLLRPGGYVLFDDLNWTYNKSPALKDSDWVRNMAEDEKTTPHIRKLVDLVVKTHTGYDNFSTIEDWFMARKKSDNIDRASGIAELHNYKQKPGFLQRIRSRLTQRSIKLRS